MINRLRAVWRWINLHLVEITAAMTAAILAAMGLYHSLQGSIPYGSEVSASWVEAGRARIFAEFVLPTAMITSISVIFFIRLLLRKERTRSAWEVYLALAWPAISFFPFLLLAPMGPLSLGLLLGVLLVGFWLSFRAFQKQDYRGGLWGLGMNLLWDTLVFIYLVEWFKVFGH